MSLRVFKGSPKWKEGIPANSYMKIESIPAQTVVYTNDNVSGEVGVNLDPGLYHVIIKKYLGRNALGRHSQLRWEERFLHDITEDEFNVLSSMRPKSAKGRMTSNGWAFQCGVQGCDYACNNTIAMVLHELKHQNITRKEIVENSDYLIMKNMEKKEEAPDEPKKRGRPRSFHSES